jgi:hypothetical protein
VNARADQRRSLARQATSMAATDVGLAFSCASGSRRHDHRSGPRDDRGGREYLRQSNWRVAERKFSRYCAPEGKKATPEHPSGRVGEDDVLAPRHDAALALYRSEAPLRAISPADTLTLQRSVGNQSVRRLIARRVEQQEPGERSLDDPSADRHVVQYDALVHGEPISRQPAAIHRDPQAGEAPSAPAPASVLLQAVPIEFNLETKGPKSEGYVKLNKAYLKGQAKLSVSGAPEGAVNVGPTFGGKSSDGKTSGQVGVAADAKQTAQIEMTKRFDAMVNSLVKSVTGQDEAVKTELFAKAKAEAKAGTKEASAKIGYDFGVDVTVFGVGKATAAVKFTLAGLKYKPSEKPPVSATVLAAEASGKLAAKWKKAFQLLGNHYDIEGALEWGAEFEPNWEKIALDAVKDVGVEAGVMLAIDAALVAGPPLLAGIIVAQGIYMAGEKGALFARINEGAIDARQAAMDYAQMMTGSEMSPTGPRAQAAVARASAELNRIASSTQVSVPELMTELRKTEGPANFVRIHSQARQQVFSAYESEVRKVIQAWRDEHYILAIWTRQEDDVTAAMRQVNIIFSH